MTSNPLTTFLKVHRQLIFVVLGIFILFFVLQGQSVSAQEAPLGTQFMNDVTTASGEAAPPDPVVEEWGWAADIARFLAKIVFGLAVGLGGLIAGIGGLFLDIAVSQTILQAGEHLNPNKQGSVGEGIVLLWTVVRDIFNILFIFGLIYIGIKTILSSDDSNTRKTLGFIIIAALLINFSLYATQVIIDFTNIAATQVFNQIMSGNGTIASYHDNLVKTKGDSISGAFLNIAGVTSFFGANAFIEEVPSPIKIILFGLMFMIFLMVAGFVFAMGAFMLVSRFIKLIIYMILSPVMFAGWIFPKFQSFQDRWWKGFFQQAFFAPAFLFMIYLSLVVLQRLMSVIGDTSPDFSALMTGGRMGVDEFVIAFFFVLMIGFLYASAKVGEMMSVAGGSTAVKALQAMGKGARNAAQSFAYRPVGNALNRVVGGIDAIDRAAENGSKRARFARTIMGGEATRRAVEKASNYGAGGLGRDALEKDAATRKQRATRSNQIIGISNAIKNGATNKIAMERAVQNASSSQITDMIKGDDLDQVKAAAGLLSESQMKSIMDDREIDDATKKAISETRAAKVEERLTGGSAALNDVIGKADIVDLKALGFDTALTHAGKLSAKQIEDWKDLTPTEKAQLKDARKEQLKTEYGIDPVTKAVTGTGAATLFGRIVVDEERSKLPAEILKHASAAQYLNTNVLTKIVDNPGVLDSDRAAIKRAVMAYYHVGHADHVKYRDFFDKNNAGQRY